MAASVQLRVRLRPVSRGRRHGSATVDIVAHGTGGDSPTTTLVLTADPAAPTADFTTPDEGSTTYAVVTELVVAWTDTDGTGGSGIATRSLQRETAPLAGGVCGTWTADGSPIATESPITSSGLLAATCYRWALTVTDQVGNTAAGTSGTLVTASAPPAPDVVARSRTGAYQAEVNGPVFFRPDPYATVALTATVPGNPPSVTSVSFGGLDPATGWTSTPTLPNADDTAPYEQSLAASATAGWASLIVTTQGAGGLSSAPRTLTLAPDATPPVVAFTSPTEGVGQATTATVSWTITDVGSGVGDWVIQRERRTAGPDGSCLGFDWAPDGTRTVVASPLAETGLLSGYCYRWTILATDQVGNFTNATSAMVAVDDDGPTITFDSPSSGETIDQGSAGNSISWSEQDQGSGVASRSLQRQRTAIAGSGCGSSWTDDGEPTTDASPVLSRGFEPATCYRWVLTATDRAGNTSAETSGSFHIGPSLLTSHFEGSVLFSSESLNLQTTDPDVDHVELLVDGSIVATASSVPYVMALDTPGLTDGSHAIQANVVHTGGSTTTTAPTTVTVSNSLGTTARLQADRNAGPLTLDSWVLYGLYASVAPNSLPARYASAPLGPDRDLAAYDYLTYWSQLSSGTRETIQGLLDQPLLGQYYGATNTIGAPESYFHGCITRSLGPSGATETSCTLLTPHFEIVYTPVPAGDPGQYTSTGRLVSRTDAYGYPDGYGYVPEGYGHPVSTKVNQPNYVPDAVDDVAQAAEEAYATYVGWGWQEPAVANSRRIRIQFEKPWYSARDGVSLPSMPFLAVAGIININPILQNEQADREDHLLVPHEVFHQFQFKVVPAQDGVPGWSEPEFWMEGTANWAERQFELEGTYTAGVYEDWAWNMDKYLTEPSNDLSYSDTMREYAAGSLAAWFLEEAFANDPSYSDPLHVRVVRDVFDTLASNGNDAKDAIRSTIADQSRVLASTWLEYAQTAYQMSFSNSANAGQWRASLASRGATRADPPTGNPTGPDNLGRARPASERVPLFSGTWTPDRQIIIGDLGMSYVDLVPYRQDSPGTITVRLSVGSDQIAARLVPYSSIDPSNGPMPCGPAIDLTGTSDQTATVATSAACQYATLILVRPTYLRYPWVPVWSANYTPGGITDTFTRPDSPNWGVSDSGQGWDIDWGSAEIVGGTGHLTNNQGDNAYSQATLTGEFAWPLQVTLDVSQATGGFGGIMAHNGSTTVYAYWQSLGDGTAALNLTLWDVALGERSVETGTVAGFDPTSPGVHTVTLDVNANSVSVSMAGYSLTVDRRDGHPGPIPPIAPMTSFSVRGDASGGGSPLLVVDNVNITAGH